MYNNYSFTTETGTKNSTFNIVSMVAYLIGVPKRIFDNENEPPRIEIYERLDKEKSARIIRHLCILRTSIERNFKNINDKMKSEYKTILSLPEYVPQESINRLNLDGISFVKKSSVKLNQHIIEINRLIADRINNCKGLFPSWIKWEYIKDMFIMPNGLSEDGTKEASDVYYANLMSYPYQVYINWTPRDNGNILLNDRKFVILLYQWHNDYFYEMDKVSDAGTFIKGNIYEHIENSEKIAVVVDCENSDPYKLMAVLKNLDYEYTRKISKIILFDDVNTVSAWQILDKFIKIPVEHILIERVKSNKSLVDIMLTARACQEHYQNNVDSFIIVSSDSDYWGLITSLQEARFLVMVEKEGFSADMKNALESKGIFYCYIDDFYQGNLDDVKRAVLINEMSRYIDGRISLNINDMFDESLREARIEMNENEKQQFISKYLRTLQAVIDDDGELRLEFKYV